MHVDRHIEPLAPQPSDEREIVEQPPRAAPPRDDDHVIEVRIVDHDRRRVLLDEIRETPIRVRPPQRADDRRREHHVTYQPQSEQQDLHSLRS